VVAPRLRNHHADVVSVQQGLSKLARFAAFWGDLTETESTMHGLDRRMITDYSVTSSRTMSTCRLDRETSHPDERLTDEIVKAEEGTHELAVIF
jgi:hypothetical protein